MPAPTVHSALLAEALALHRQGRLQEAESRYKRILVKEPGNVAVRYNLGLAQLQRGDFEEGITVLKQLLKFAPRHVEAHYNLGRAYSEQRKHPQALICFEHVAALQPNLAEAHFYLGMTLASLGRKDAALAPLERALSLRPELAEAHHALASVLSELGRYEAALSAFEKAIALRTGFAEAHNGLGTALFRLNRLEEAGTQYRQAIRLKPGLAEAYTGLSDVLRTLGQNRAAADCCEQAIRIRPDDGVAHAVLGQALSELGKHEAALAAFERALALWPGSAATYNELGAVLHLWGRHDEARSHGEKALKLDPANAKIGSIQLFNLHYDPSISAAELASRHRAFGECFEAPLKSSWQPRVNVPDPGRPLRVGFVSGDFRQHPVGFFMADLLAGLRATGLELYAYANQWMNDAMTERIKPQFAIWRECQATSDAALAAQICADGIDILVDLAGHTKGNRLLVFARKPAPVQVTYLGYPDTTGLSAIDYILGDNRMFPESEEALYVEKPWRLPDTALCFMPPDLPVEVGILPAVQNGFVTFGCLNKSEKVSDAAVETWAKILYAVPGSRLLLQNKPNGDAAIAAHMRRRFAVRGIEADRLELVGKLSWHEHMEIYNRVDIALDPFPYNGTTTTVEGLWMGVPLLALTGDRLVAHMGESIMHAVAMPEWIATDQEDYIARAVAFAGDLAALAAVRAGLRARLLASPICDAPRFARNLEEAFRGMWRKWCEQQDSPKSAH